MNNNLEDKGKDTNKCQNKWGTKEYGPVLNEREKDEK